MRESKTHTIGDFNYTITQLGAKQGRVVLARVMRAVAGAAGDAATSAGTDGAEAALVGMAKLVESLSDADVDYFCDTFSKTTLVARESTPDKQVPLADQFDDHFAGRYGAMIKWLWAALETNYASFLGDLGLDTGALAKAAKAAMSKSSTPINPIAPSGASSSPASGV
jgi:hypothetical protein